MFREKNLRTAMLTAGLLAMGPGAISAASTVDLNGIGFVQYGDGWSYSMPLANYQVTGDFTPQPGDPFYIKSTPGEIASLVVPATGASGVPVTTNFSGMDDAYATPSGAATGENFFQTGGLTSGGITYPAPDPGGMGEFTGDAANTWDATLASLQTFLEGDQLVFFFNNNQFNQTQAQQSLAAWALLWITDNSGSIVDPDGAGPETGYYEFSNELGAYALVSEGGGGVLLGDPTTYISDGGGPQGTTNASTDYVLSGGEICLDAGGLPVSCTSTTAITGPVNHNLGADNAAYAVVFPELNALMDNLFASDSSTDLEDVTLHVDMRFGCDPVLFGTDPDDPLCDGEGPTGWGKNLNNGFEQVFIGRLAPYSTAPVPEASVLALLGLGLFGLGVAGRRRRT